MDEPGVELFSRYLLERELAGGLLGAVWRATDQTTGDVIDLRIIRGVGEVAQLRVAVEQAAALSHRRLVRVLRFENDGDLCGIVAEPCDGETMPARRSRRTRAHYEVSEIKPWVKPIVEGLAYIHQNGLVHGALHPAGIFLEGVDVQVGFLGVHPLIRPGDDGSFPIPLPTAPPDALAGNRPAPPDDVYALAAMIYDLLTGKPVFHSGDVATQIAEVVPPPLAVRRRELGVEGAAISPAWEAWIAGALAKDRSARPDLHDLIVIMNPTRDAPVAAPATSRGEASAAAAALVAIGAVGEKVRHYLRGRRRLVIGAAAGLAGLGLWIIVGAGRGESPAAVRAGEAREAFQAVVESGKGDGAEPGALIASWRAFLERYRTPQNAADGATAKLLALADKRVLHWSTQQQRLLREEGERLAERQERFMADFRDDLETARVAAVASASSAEKIASWKAFRERYDGTFEGRSVSGMIPFLAEAEAEMRKIEQRAEAEMRLDTQKLGEIRAADIALRSLLADEVANAADKRGAALEFVRRFGGVSFSPAAREPGVELEGMLESATGEAETWYAKAAEETPSEPLKLAGLFAPSEYASFSDNGKKRILKKVQQALKEVGQYDGRADGGAGPKTHNALLAFQLSAGLIPTATLDLPTFAALGLGELVDDSTPLRSRRSGGSSSRRAAAASEEPSFFRRPFRNSVDWFKDKNKKGSR